MKFLIVEDFPKHHATLSNTSVKPMSISADKTDDCSGISIYDFGEILLL